MRDNLVSWKILKSSSKMIFWFVLSLVSACGGAIIHPESDLLYEGSACTMKDGNVGVCRTAKQCDWFIQDVLIRKQVSYYDVIRCTFDGFDEVVCCGEVDPSSNILRQELPTVMRKSEAACQDYPIIVKQITFLIAVGVIADLGEFPHMTALGYEPKNNNYTFRCGASLISENYLLTAAHCCPSNNPPVIARLGKVTLYSNVDGGEAQDIGIKNIIRHPGYTFLNRTNDIALLELESSYVPSDYVYPACLHSNVQDLSPDIVLSAEGWGSTSHTSLELSSSLMKVNLTSVDAEVCNRTYFNSNTKIKSRRGVQKISEGQLCAIGSLVNDTTGDTCGGDSGGPLQYLQDGRFRIVGVTSFGGVCGTKMPGVYTKVATYLNWIESVVWP